MSGVFIVFWGLLSRCPSRDTWDSGTSWDSFELLEQAADGRFAEAQFDGDLADRFSGCFQFSHLLLALLPIIRSENSQVFAFTGIADEGELKETLGLDDFIEEDVISAVLDLTGPGLELLDIPELVIPAGHTDGEGAVKEVVQALAPGQVILGDWPGGVTLGGMGYYKDRPILLLLQVHQFYHETSCIGALLGSIAQVAEIVDDDDPTMLLFGSVRNI